MPNNAVNHPKLIRSLGIFGWNELEPTILAALASESPLLLIGPHGTAKSMLLEKLAEAMDLNFRHYNASTLNFDDLVGFPIPDGDSVRYLRTPLDAWNAEAIFVDEISRCRIDMQNRLFPLVHECRLQGQKLTKLRYRWAAMNPPPCGEEDENHQYIGAEALDPAFADRFPWIIQVPTELSKQDFMLLIRGTTLDKNAGTEFQNEIQQIRSRLKTTEEMYGEQVAHYIQTAYPLLKKYNLPLSNRRVRYLYFNILALIATQRYDNLVEPAIMALQNSLPQRCWSDVSEMQVIKISHSAEKCLERQITGLEKDILMEICPLKRAKIAIAHNEPKLFIPIVLDGRNSLSYGQRLIFSHILFGITAKYRSRFPALTFEMLAEDVSEIETCEPEDIIVPKDSPEHLNAEMVLQETKDLPTEKMWLKRVLYLSLKNKVSIAKVLDYAVYAQNIADELEHILSQKA